MKNHFARRGCPDRVISDNGPQFVSAEFRKFTKEWDFQQRTSNPGNSKGNGMVESGVKTAKNLLQKSLDTRADPFIDILDYRYTPTQGMNTSPVQLLMNRRTRTLLPTTKVLVQPGTPHPERKFKGLTKKEQQQTKYYNRNARDLPALSEGDVVRIKPRQHRDKVWKKGTVTSRLDKRSYMVELLHGATYRRN